MAKKILTKKFERDFAKKSCLEYCYLDPAYCPLYNAKQGDGTTTGINVTTKRWTDVENGTSYTISSGTKKRPHQQGGGTDEIDNSGIPDYANKLAFENAHTPYSCWGDGSGFEYDIMPENVIGPSGVTESIYDITDFGIDHQPLKLSNWNAWAEKVQLDYRFAQVSDLNATTTLFPNVDDPWMFTEYVFKGVEEGGEVVVEPPLYYENSLKIRNADHVFPEQEFKNKKLEDKYDPSDTRTSVVTTEIPPEEEGGEADYKHDKFYHVKQFRQIVNWDEFNRDEAKRGNREFPVKDAGVRLYRVDVPVESIKWGEHGNVPPHTINMSAPANWFEARQVGKIKPKYIAHIGTPFFASSYGVLYWHNKEAYVEAVDILSMTRTDDYYSYDVNDPSGAYGVKQNMPSTLRNSNGSIRNEVKKISEDKAIGDFIHGGCAFMEGKNGRCRCKAMDDAAGEEMDYLSGQFNNFAQCSTYNYATPTCTRRIQDKEFPILATYEGVATSRKSIFEQMHGVYSGEGAEDRAFADSVMGGSVGLPMADMTSIRTSSRMGRTSTFYETQVSVWYETSFEYVYEDANSVEMESPGMGAFKQGATIKRGTGKMAITTSDNSSPFRQGEPDNFAFGDLDQLSFHRWFNNVMHCQNCAYCNDTYGSLKMTDGYEAGKRAGGDGDCRYYSNKHDGRDCPTDRVPKRAYEFQMMTTTAFPYFFSMSQWWMGMDEEERLDYNVRFIYERVFDKMVEDPVTHEMTAKYKNSPTSQYFLMPVYIGEDSDLSKTGKDSADILGTFDNPDEKSAENNIAYIIYCREDPSSSSLPDSKTYTQKIVVPESIVEHIKNLPEYNDDEGLLEAELNGNTTRDDCHKIGMMSFTGDCFFWYDALADSGASVGTWFIKADPNFKPATYNSVLVDNDDKFIGGFHPQYKNYGDRGEEFMQDVESDSYRDAMGDIIGDADHDGIPQPVNKKGYWIDFSGKYIVDEAKMPIDEPLAGDDDRKELINDPAKTISFRESNTSMSAEDGEMQNPEVINCSVVLNDSYSLLWKYKYDKGDTPPVYDNGLTGGRKGWSYPDARPQYEDNNGNSYWAPPYVADMFAIPTMRMVAHCTKCGYYLAYKYHDLLCPWCGKRLVTVPGDRGEGVVDGKSWNDFFIESKDVANPDEMVGDGSGGYTYEGKKVVNYMPVMKKLFKVKAIGTVQVWAPAGTSIKKDAYYWKNPTVVNNSIKAQIKQRLGTNVDGSWKFDKMSRGSEVTLGMPDQIGTFKPMPQFESAEMDKDEFYAGITWKGVTKDDRNIYASYNDIMPTAMMPMLGTGNPTNENLILPYTDKSNDGLKMITINEIKSLRNHLQPMLGYISEVVPQNDFHVVRAAFKNREDVSYPRFYSKKKCMALPVIQAVSEAGDDCFVQFWSGDPDFGTVREYYPAGTSWWKLNNVIGGKYDDLTGGYYHCSGGKSASRWVHSKAAIFIHGMLPLDKEILKAYVIYYPAGEPYKEPIGRGWNGVVHYEHYHPFTEEHHGDGAGRHLHGQAGFLGNFDENGNYTQADGGKIRLMDESDYYGWGDEGDKFNALEEYTPFIDDKFGAVVTNLSGVYDDQFWKQYGIAVTSVANTGLRYYNISPGDKEDKKFKYVQRDSNGDLKVMYSFSEIWRDKTVGEMRDIVDNHLVDVTLRVGDGTLDNTIENSITQWSSKMLNDIIPENTQNIPGYFNYSGFNSAQAYGSNFKIGGGLPEYFDGPVIVQGKAGVCADAGDADPDSYSGTVSQTENNAGIKPRIIDATEVVKKLYNKRVDRSFICSGGMSLSEVLAQSYPTTISRDGYYPSVIEWAGTGSPTQNKRDEAAAWNKKTTDSAFVGYLLNDSSNYPKLDNDLSLGSNDTGGDKYEQASFSKIEFFGSCLTPFDITPDNSEYHIELGLHDKVQTTKKDSLNNQTIYSIEDAIIALESLIGPDFIVSKVNETTYKVSQVNDSTIKKIEIKDVPYNCYESFGLAVGARISIQDRCIGVSTYVEGYHPSQIGTGGSWLFNLYNDSQQYFVLDLVRTPIEISESNYRHTAPSIDCTACYCPSSGCSSSGQPVGAYIKSIGGTMLPNETACPVCGTDLSNASGVVSKPGDGIYTYTYDRNFHVNAFVTGVHIRPSMACGYRVSIRGSTENYWMPIVNVAYDSSTGNYTNYPCYGNTSPTSQSTPFEKFVIPESKYRRSRYVLVECDGIKQDVTENCVVNEDVSDDNRYRVAVTGNFSNMGVYDFSGLKVSGLKLSSGGANDGELRLITTELDEASGIMTLYFDTPVYNKKNDVVTIGTHKWVGGISVCKVYGTHYRESDLKITDSEEAAQFYMDSENLEFTLPEYPTQIMGVSCGKNGMGGIELAEVESEGDLKWATESKTVTAADGQEHTIHKISGGKYLFDYKRNRIRLPAKNQDNVPMGEFESALIGAKYSGTFMPSILTVRYWSGNGYEIELEADALGEGPSFQLEKESINRIDTTSAFPDNGKTVKMQAYGEMTASRKNIPWYCYNKEAVTMSEIGQIVSNGYWGEANIPYNALGKDDKDKTFVDLFGENNCLLRGRARTRVTFVGGPNQIVSGNIVVTAPKKTSRVIQLGDSKIEYYERTGGIENGCIIVSAVLDACEGRKTLAWSVPTLVIYAKERDSSENFT